MPLNRNTQIPAQCTVPILRSIAVHSGTGRLIREMLCVGQHHHQYIQLQQYPTGARLVVFFPKNAACSVPTVLHASNDRYSLDAHDVMKHSGILCALIQVITQSSKCVVPSLAEGVHRRTTNNMEE